MPHLGHAILFVVDLATSMGFYRDLAGLEHRFTDAGYAEFDTGATRFALYELGGHIKTGLELFYDPARNPINSNCSSRPRRSPGVGRPLATGHR